MVKLLAVVLLSVSGAAGACIAVAGPLPENPEQDQRAQRDNGEYVIFDNGAWRTDWDCIPWKEFIDVDPEDEGQED